MDGFELLTGKNWVRTSTDNGPVRASY